MSKVNLLNVLSLCVLSQWKLKVGNTQPENPNLINFIVFRKLRQILIKLDVMKSKGPNGYPSIFYQKTAERMSVILQIIMNKKTSELTEKLENCHYHVNDQERQQKTVELPASIAA